MPEIYFAPGRFHRPGSEKFVIFDKCYRSVRCVTYIWKRKEDKYMYIYTIYICFIFITILKILKEHARALFFGSCSKYVTRVNEFPRKMRISLSVRISISSMKSFKCDMNLSELGRCTISYRSSNREERERKCSIILYLYHGSTMVP